jgi:hypothetical protein
LPSGDDFRQGVGFSLRLDIENGATHIVNGQDQVTAAEFRLAIKESFELDTAIRTLEKTGRDDRNKKCHSAKRLIDALLPLLPPNDILSILEDMESFTRLHAHFAA